MPMLGKKTFHLVKTLTDIQPGEQIYTILHTEEQFRSKEEYEKRVELYNQNIWTCRCTGHTTLTHQEAWKSEMTALKMIKNHFPEHFEKPVLQVVHHSTESLDALVDKAWTILHTVLVVGEPVTFRVNAAAQLLKGTVVKVLPVAEGASNSSNCNSPSSDKENSSEEKEKSPKKWTPPKLLPYKYSVQLEDGPIINSVPVQDLARVDRPPSKELIRLFIRAYAVRAGLSSTSPWVVDDNLVAKHSLPSKFADFLLSPVKMAEAAKRAETLGKKRKHQGHETGSSKKVKLSETTEKSKKKKEKLTPVSQNMTVKCSPGKALKGKEKTLKQNKLKKGDGSVRKTSPVKSKKDEGVIEINDSSDEEVSLAKIKEKCAIQNEDSDFDVPLATLTNHHTPKKKKLKKLSLDGKTASPEVKSAKKTLEPSKSKTSSDKKSPGTQKTKRLTSDQKTPTKHKRCDSSDSDVPLSKLSSPKKTPSTPKSKSSSPAKKMKEKNEQTPQKGERKTTEKSSEKKGRGRPKKGEDSTPSKQGPKKSLKQVTLYELATQKPSKPAAHIPKKSPAKPATPLIVRKLMQFDKEEDRVKFNMLLKKAILVLTPQQKKNLPSPLKEKLQKKADILEEKKKLEKMTEEEREAYFKEKKERQKQQLKEKLKARMKELRQRYEDQDLNLQALPAPRVVSMPDNLPNELFGDIAMVTEFISSYSGLLMPDAEYPIYTDALMKAIAGGPQGFAYLSRVLGVLLQTLLQDELAEGYSELRVPLRDIAVNPYTVSELVRLCLHKNDNSDGSSDMVEVDDYEVPELPVQLLETHEFYQLETDQKVALLKSLCLRLMSTYSVQDYMEERQREAVQLTKQRNSEMKEFNEKKRDKQTKGNQGPGFTYPVNGETSQENSPAVTLASFYGKKLDDTSTNDSAVDSQEDDDNLVSIVKRRRLMAAKAAAEKEKRELERRLQREKEHQEERARREREQFETKFKDSINLARTVLRHVPIGYDRHHNRYWIFTNTTPGLYVEKGWVTQNISYNPGGVPFEKGRNEDQTYSSAATSSTPEKNSDAASRPCQRKKKAVVESTSPHFGQNLWFTYPSVKDLDGLLKALHPQGIREGALKAELKKRYPDICRAITAAQRNNLELRDSDGTVEMIAGFKKELADIELRLRNGGLGGVQNYSSWETKLMAAEDCATLGACLLEVQEWILDKFLQGFMKRPKQSEKSDKTEEGESSEADDGDNDKSNREERKLSAAEQRLQQWKDAAENCPTLSRLHVLLSMMDSCIKWEKSAENAKCKICRKKCDDDRLLLCDECNQAFHMYCLRPALVSVPRGDWYCPACVPQSKRRTQVPKRFADESESDADDSEEEEDVAQSMACEECGGEEEELITCGSCRCVYHLDCHQPPLRRAPRGSWECSNCKNGNTRQKKKRPQRRAAALRKNYCDDDSPSEHSDANSRFFNHTSSGTRRSGRLSGGDAHSRTRSSDRHADLSQHRSRRAPSDLSICEDILQRLMKHASSWPFLEPVDKKEVPDYYTIIKKPMDFQTMQKKCARLSYSSPQEFVEDAILVFSNAATYNQPDSEVYECMRVVERLFSELLAKYLPAYANTQVFVHDASDTSSTRFRHSRRN